MALGAISALAQDWGNFAIISNSLGNNANRLCVGDGSRPSDIGCPTYSPYLASGGLLGIGITPSEELEVSGTISATAFVGDGSGLTNLSVSGDRIVSGTDLVIVNDAMNTVSISLGGGSQYFHSTLGFVGLGVSTTGGISGTTGYFTSPVGIGTTSPQGALDVRGAGSVIASGTTGGFLTYDRTTGVGGMVMYRTGGINRFFDTTAGDVITYTPTGRVGIMTATPAATLQVSGSFTVSTSTQNTTPSIHVGENGRVGIGTSNPGAKLEITELTNNVGLVVNAGALGTDIVRFARADSVGSMGFNSAANRASIWISGTQAMWTMGSNLNNLVFGSGASSVYSLASRPPLMLNTNGKVGVGLATTATVPLANLDVAGTISLTDALQLGQNTISCAASVSGSIRYNTTSNTVQFCNGTGWTSLNSGTTGSVSAAGSTGDVQYNNGGVLAADTGQLFWDATNNRLGIGTGTPSYDLEVSASRSADYTAITVSNQATGEARAQFRAESNSALMMMLAHGGQRANTRYGVAMAGYADLLATEPSAGLLSGLLIGTGAAAKPILFGTNDTERMRITGTGNVGIDRIAPLAKLDVNGTISASDAIQVGQSSLACASGISGSIRYNAVSSTVEYCNSTAWVSMGPSDTVPVNFHVTKGGNDQTVTANTWTKLTWSAETRDSNNNFAHCTTNCNSGSPTATESRFTPAVPGLYLITARVGCTSSTRCNVAIAKNGSAAHYGSYVLGGAAANTGSLGSTVVYLNGSTDYVEIQGYNFDTGTILGDVRTTWFQGTLLGPQAGGGGSGPTAFDDLTDVDTAGASAGNIIAYNGSSWVVSSTGTTSALGDRITSGTVSVTVNTNGYISLTTGVTDWGYLSSGISYLPTLVANRVSATNISATHLQLSSPTTVLACNAGLAGAMRYTSGTMQVCDGSNWGNIGIGVPTGTIAAFAASSCPSGWSEYTAARGRFLRGIDTLAAGIDPDGTRAAGNTQADAAPNITGSFTSVRGFFSVGSGAFTISNQAATAPNAGAVQRADTVSFDASDSSSKYGAADEIRPKNVAVTFCVYSGFQSAPGQTILTTLASLTDVSVGGVTTGQVLTFDGASWVPSNSAVASGALGDRITSGTVSVTTNSNGYISLTTGVTDWGYLSSGNSYLPTLVAGRVSSTNISATHLQLNSPTTVLACGAGLEGAMRYTSGTMQVCDGSNWGNIGIGVPTGTIAAFNASSCPSGWTEYTAARGRFLRGIDTLAAGIDPSGTRAAGSTQDDSLKSHTHTAPVPEIQPWRGSGSNIFGGTPSYGTHNTGATGGTETRPKNVAVIFCSYSGFQSTPATVITQLSSLTDVSVGGVTTGQVLAFDGASWVPSDTTGGSNALGDRITSGTVSVTTNSNGYISLTTGVTDWGYLSSGNSSLPTLVANRVSATNVSATHLQLSSPTTVLACNAGLAGAMRYTSGTMQVCDGSNWGNIGIGVPTGTIAAFAASSCPSGWSEYTAARGRFLRGIDNGAGNDPSGTRAAGNTQDDASQRITGTAGFNRTGTGNFTGAFEVGGTPTSSGATAGSSAAAGLSFDSANVVRTANETRPKNVAVIFCSYSGFQSTPATVITQLSSLTDVSVNGVTTGQVLAFNGASWVASNTAAASSALGDRITSGTTNAIAYDSGSLTVATNGAHRMIVGQSGNVGIGTNHVAPIYTLDVSGGVARFKGSGIYIQDSGPTYTMVHAVNTVRSQIYTNSAKDIGIGANSLIDQLYLKSTGHVGISTMSPTATLQVSGTFTVSTSAQTTTPSLYVGTGGNVGVGLSALSDNNKFSISDPSNITPDANAAGQLRIAGLGYSAFIALDGSATYLGHNSALRRLDFMTDEKTRMAITGTGNVGISNTSPIAKLDVTGNVSVSGVVNVGISSLTCTSSISGSIRYSTISSTMEYCNSAAWMSLGPSETLPYSFRASKSAAQVLTAQTKITFDVEDFDTGGVYASNTFTAPVAGRYLITASVRWDAETAGDLIYLFLYKNGANHNSTSNRAGAGTSAESITLTTIVDASAGDTFDIYGLHTGTTATIMAAQAYNFFAATLIGPQAGGGGTASAAGSTGDIQFNNGGNLAADTGQLFWDATNNRLGIGTSAPSNSLHVNGQIVGGFGAMGTTGTLDWDDSSNARPGSGYSLMRSLNAINGPTAASTASYYHPFSFEYATKNGTGNITQFAIPYAQVASFDDGMFVRGRIAGTWTGWYTFPTIRPNGLMYISGSVGIGTTTQTAAQLNVAGDVRLSGATSNSIAWGTTGVAAPAAGSVGMKLQLNGTTPNTMALGDYALGIENSTMWFNTGGGYKFYVAGNGTLGPVISSAGRIGVGTDTPSNSIHIHQNTGTLATSFPTNTSHAGISVRNNDDGQFQLYAYGTAAAGSTMGIARSTGLFALGYNLTTAFGTYTANDTVIGTNNTERMRILSTGNIGIGNANPGSLLDVGEVGGSESSSLTGNAFIKEYGTGGYAYLTAYDGVTSNSIALRVRTTNAGALRDAMILAAAGNATINGASTSCVIGSGAGATNCTSDARLKERVRPIEGALDKIMALNGVTFHWKDKERDKHEFLGLIAQNVEKVFPQAVEIMDDSNNTLKDVKALDYAVLVAPLIEAVKELAGKLGAHDDEIAALKAANDNLRLEMKAANDNYRSLKTEMEVLRKVVAR